MNPLVVIPARGGSKGLPGKNIKLLYNKPLIHYTIEAAREIFADDKICVSTDSKEIIKVVEQTGLKVPFKRPAELATDQANTQDVLLNALEYYNSERDYHPDTIVLLQVTSPFRNKEHIKEALNCYYPAIDMVVSVKKTDANPYYTLKEEDETGFLRSSKKSSFIRRQECPVVYELNGAIYVINVDSLRKGNINEFKKVKKYVMNKEDSIDIDDYIDWEVAKAIVQFKNK